MAHFHAHVRHLNTIGDHIKKIAKAQEAICVILQSKVDKLQDLDVGASVKSINPSAVYLGQRLRMKGEFDIATQQSASGTKHQEPRLTCSSLLDKGSHNVICNMIKIKLPLFEP